MDLISTCNSIELSNFLTIVKRVLLLIQIIGPILCIIGLILSFINIVNNPEDKKESKKIFNKLISLILLFFIPLLVNAVMGLLGTSTNLSSCWNNSSDVIKQSDTYISTEGTNSKSSVISSTDEYENGVEKPKEEEDNNNSNSNSSSTSVSRVVFIGDSRTVQMYAYLTNDWNGANYSSGGIHEVGDDVFIAQGSMGLNWMKSTGIPAARKYLSPGTAVVILMGVNDLTNSNKYIDYINENISSWTESGSKVYYSTVTPCNGKYSHLNSSIASFNSKIKSSLPSSVKIIDTNSYLTSNGFDTTDGLHYNKDTSNKIYQYIKSNL